MQSRPASLLSRYGIDDTDPLFHEFGTITLATYEDGECPWVPLSIDSAELREIVTEEASEDWWQASFVYLPDVSLGGPTSAKATAALCRDFGIDIGRLTPGNSGWNDRLLVHVAAEVKRACPECRGAGVNFELDDVAVCGSWSGAGTV